LGQSNRNEKAVILANTLDAATGKLLMENKGPQRKVGELDNRGSHFYLAQYWAQALAEQHDNHELSSDFAELARVLTEQENAILTELNGVQGQPVEIGGYYKPDPQLCTNAMRPSAILNAALAAITL